MKNVLNKKHGSDKNVPVQSITFVAGIMTMNRRSLNASLRIHQSIFHRVLHSTIDFIWTTPVGQVSNLIAVLIEGFYDSNFPSSQCCI